MPQPPTSVVPPPRVLFCTLGSRGDVHPYIAVARALAERGVSSAVATGAEHRETFARAGVELRVVPPSRADFDPVGDVMPKVMDPRAGGEYIFREIVMPFLERTYAATLNAARGADLIVGHPLALTAPMVAEQLRIPYAYSVLQSLAFFSAFDPPILAPVPWLRHLAKLGALSRPVYRGLYRLIDLRVRGWVEPVAALRRRLGLPPATANPMIDGLWSPTLNLAMFTPLLSPPQPDWPANTVVTGTCLYDDPGAGSDAAALEAFMQAGEPPVTITLGSAAVEVGGALYAPAVEAVLRTGRRCVALVGGNAAPSACDGKRAIAAAYAPFSTVFGRSAAIIHQCGAGTTAQALRAGVPQLCVPFAHDQPDNAQRLRRAGVGLLVAPGAASRERIEGAVRRLLDERAGFLARAAALGRRACEERGAETAAEAIVRVLEGRGGASA